uniref:Uncharacterized protein n=1 Tax=Anopheles epiroticus TaxID=199890 RepID=A0A182P3H7_9DIPT
MSILLQETGGGGCNANTVASSGVTAPIEDGSDGSSLAAENVSASKEACMGDCHYARSWKKYMELPTQQATIEDDDGEQHEKQEESSPENDGDCVCLAQPDSSECHNSKSAEHQGHHSGHLLPLNCCCRMCIASREMVMQLYGEDCQYNSLWDRLQLLMKQYYDLIPESEDNALYNQYMELMSKSSLKWLTDAPVNKNNNIQMSLASNLPLSNEMAFVMLTNVLSTRDPHQLFELLCFQLRSIVQVYCVGFEDLFTENPDDGSRQFNAPEVLNYIVNGYKKLRQSARTVAPLLNVLEQCHLGKFGLTWWLINQRIFQRYFYYEVQSILPECMLRLRGSLPDREYQELVGRFLKFDKEMTDISLSWADVWPLLYDYHRSPEDRDRRNRIKTAHMMLEAIRSANYTPKSPELFEKPERPIAEWLELKNRKLAWEYVVHCLKTKWIPGVSSRLTNVCDYASCPCCDRPLNTHNICLTCIIGGGIFTFRPKKEVNERYRLCTCANMIEMLFESQGKKVPHCEEDDSTANSHKLLSSLLLNSESATQNGCSNASSPEHATLFKGEAKKDDKQTAQESAACLPLVEALGEDEELYHIAWAIFKHLPERLPYSWSTLEPSRFCSFQAAPCSSIACRVAINIIAMNYPVHLSRLLIQTYKPVSEEPRRIMKGNWSTKARNSLRRLCDNVNKRFHEEIHDQMHPLLFVDMFWTLQNTTFNLPKTRASELAEWFTLDTPAPPRNVFYQYFTKFFLVKESDIMFDLESFERERERSVSPSQMRESIMQKLESNAALLAPCPTTLSSSVSSTSSSSSSSSCMSSSNSSSSSSCSLSTTSAASVAAAAAAAAAAASSFIEPIADASCITNGGMADDGKGCTCTCNSCVTEFLSKSEMLSKQLDTSARDSWTQRTNLLEMELKALLKERNMLLEQGRGKRNPCKLLNCNEQCTSPKAGATDSPKVELNVDSKGTKATVAKQDVVACSVSELSDSGAMNGPQQIEASKHENLILGENKSSLAKDAKSAADATKAIAAAVPSAQGSPLSKASLNEISLKSTSSVSSTCTQAACNAAETIATTVPTAPNEELQTPAKLSAFAKLAASKIPAPTGGSTTTKALSKQEPGACANGPVVKAKPLPTAPQQPGNGGHTVPNTTTPPASTAPQKHSSSKPCPCGLPSHASGSKTGTAAKSKSATGTVQTPQASINGGATAHSKEEHKKSCHRAVPPAAAAPAGEKAEGSCVCYYCTLFGQSECNHNQRTNETREKLRKKLQKQQMMNDKMFNEERQKQQLQQKPVSGDSTVLAKDCKPPVTKAAMNSSSSAASSSAASKTCSTLNTVPSVNGNSKAVIEKGSKKTAKSASMPSKDRFQSIDELLRFIEGDDTSSTKGPEKASSGAGKGGPTQSTVPSAPSGNIKQVPEKKNKKTAKTAAAAASAPSKERLQSIDELLRFIEGDEASKAPNNISKGGGKSNRIQPPAVDKGVQQKPVPATKPTTATAVSTTKDSDTMKKAKLNESLKMVAELEVLRQRFYNCQKQEQKTAQLLQDPTKLSKMERKELPLMMQAYREQKNDLHAAINVLVSSIRNEIPEYPFKLEAFATPPPCCQPSQHPLQQKKSVQSPAFDDAQAGRRVAPGTMLPPPPSTLTAAGKTSNNNMVTIKRTFLPHTEPQVTVTAKGDSPDQDQVLYTFINGQIVPINEPAGTGDLTHQHQKPKKMGHQASDAPTAPSIAGTEKPKQMKNIANNVMQKPEDPFADFSPQQKRLIQEYVDQLYNQPLDAVQIEDGDQDKRSSRSKKKSGKPDGQQQEQQQTILIKELLQERMLRQSVELIKNLQTDRKGNPEMLSLANKVKKDLLEMQKNPKSVSETGGTNNASVTLNNQPAKKESSAKSATTSGDDRQEGKRKVSATDVAKPVETGKGKNKKERKKDKLIDEIDEIVARLNLLDSDEEETKPTSKRKQKSSAASTKQLNRKQSKDSVISSGSGSVPDTKQQTKAQAKQQTPQPLDTKREKQSLPQETQAKKKGASGSGQKSMKEDNSANEKSSSKDKSKSQPVQTLSAADPSVEESQKIVVRKKAPKTFIDPEFDNNAFRLLNMDDSESDVEEEEEIEQEQEIEVKSASSLKVSSSASSQPMILPQSKGEEMKDIKKKLKETSLAVEPQGSDKTKNPNTANAQKNASEKEKKSAQKKATKQQQDRDSNQSATSAGSGSSKQQAKREDTESTAGSSNGNDAESRPKKQTPAQAMVEKISALLDSPGLSNRQRKQMIRQLEQAQATIQSQLLQNAAKATKAKVQAQAQQDKIANQKATNVLSGSYASVSKGSAGKDTNSKTRQVNMDTNSASEDSTGSTSGAGVSSSLMDQLRRGIRAEGLDLPPGITLTRLDAIQSEALRLKRESIRKITEPMKPVAPPLDPTPAMLTSPFGVGAGAAGPGMFVVNPMSPLSVPSAGQESVIMVNTGKLRGKEQQPSPLPEAAGQNGAGERKKRNKRRNKNKAKDAELADHHPASTGASAVGNAQTATSNLNDGNNIVTLRNPMFHGGPMGIGGAAMRPPGAAMMPDVQGARMTLGYDQPATIFKNDNGMFTIRNPALHHALSGGAPPEATGFRPFNAAYLVENGIMPPAHGAVHHPVGTAPHVSAAVTSGTSTIVPGSSCLPPYLQQYSSPAMDDNVGPRKCKSVIGSEMKNAQKQKQNSLQQVGGLGQAASRGWQHMNGTAGQDIFATSSTAGGSIGSGRGDSQYSSFSQYSLAGQDLLHSAPTGPANAYGGSGMLGSSGYYQTSGSGSSGKGVAGAIGSERSQALSYLGGADASASLATHCCDDEPPSAFFSGNSLGSLPSGGMSTLTKFDDLVFLQNLQPGQRLNSEVTIHSINESKMRRQQAQNFTHDIQITAIPAPSPPTAPGRGMLGAQAATSTVSLQHMMAQAQHLAHHRQQQLPQDTQPHFSDLSPGSGSVGSGSGSGTGAGVSLTDFMDSRISAGSNTSAPADLLIAPSLEMDAKSYLRDYQLGQLQQQMQDLQLQTQQQQLKGEFVDNLFATKQPIVGVRDKETDERELDSLERFNYFFNAPSSSSKLNLNREPAGGSNATAATIVTSSTGTPDGAEEGNPGGVSIGGDELQRPQQPPIGTPSSKSIQQHRLQQNGTPISSAGTALYPATADSPASSVSVFDGISSSLSSQTHSFDDLYTGLLATASPPSSISGGIEGNKHLNMESSQQHQVSAETVPFSGSGYATSIKPSEATNARNTADHATDSSAALSNK